MRLSDWLAALRRYWWAALLTILATTGLAGAATASMAKTYESTSQVFFYVGQAESVTDLNEGTVYAQYQLQSYAELVTTPSVLEPVIEQLHLDTSPAGLASRTTVSAPAQLTVMTISVKDSDGQRAWQTSKAIATQLQKVVNTTVPVQKGQPMLESRVITDTAAPTSPSSPSMSTNLLLGAVAGLALALLLLALLQARSRHHKGQARAVTTHGEASHPESLQGAHTVER